ncbi:hypothetical protein P8452_48675 [Trifolium repens]|nr:hypothetical protein P8452_48675 [Trifolium repens]
MFTKSLWCMEAMWTSFPTMSETSTYFGDNLHAWKPCAQALTSTWRNQYDRYHNEMEFAHVSVLALFCLAFVGIGATPSGEDYWQSVWPNTPLPKAFYDLLLPSGKTNNLPIRAC